MTEQLNQIYNNSPEDGPNSGVLKEEFSEVDMTTTGLNRNRNALDDLYTHNSRSAIPTMEQIQTIGNIWKRELSDNQRQLISNIGGVLAGTAIALGVAGIGRSEMPKTVLTNEQIKNNTTLAEGIKITREQLKSSKVQYIKVNRAQGIDTVPKKSVENIMSHVGKKFKTFDSDEHTITAEYLAWFISTMGQESNGNQFKKGGLKYLETESTTGNLAKLKRIKGLHACFGYLQACDEKRASWTYTKLLTRLYGEENIPSHEEFLNNEEMQIFTFFLAYKEKLLTVREYPALDKYSDAEAVGIGWIGLGPHITRNGELKPLKERQALTDYQLTGEDYGGGVITRKYAEAIGRNINAIKQGKLLEIK
jgi:hypothetical protein